MNSAKHQIHPVHPAAELFPMMDDHAFAEFKADIALHGIKEWGTLYRGQVLDGRNRYKACQELGIEMDFFEIEDKEGFDPIAYVLSHNLHRRHLTTSQRAMVAADLATLKHGGDRKSEEIKGQNCPLIIDDAAKQLNVSPKSVKNAKRVKDKGTPELAEMVSSGKVSVDAASKVATKPKAEQEAIVAKGPVAVKEAAKATVQPVQKKVPKGAGVKPEIKSYLTEFRKLWNECDDIGKKAIFVWLQDNYKND